MIEKRLKLEKVKNINEIGYLVRRKRKELGLSQMDAAGLLGVGVRFLSELERGKQTLAVGKVLQVIEGLGLEVQIKERQPWEGRVD